MKNIFHRLIRIGLYKDLNSYEAKRVQVFNYSNFFGFLAAFTRAIYISLLSTNHYTTVTMLVNLLPLVVCITMALCMHKRKYKTATYISFLCLPPTLFITYIVTLDASVSFFLIMYLIFPFFFLHRRKNIMVAFFIATTCFLLIQLAGELHLLGYDSTFYKLDVPLAYINSIFSFVFIFSSLYAIKFLIWSYEKSINNKKKELKELNHFKDKVFSIISHDLRSPFAATSQLLDLVNNVEMDKAEFSGYMTELKAQVDNARELMDNMLIWARNQMESQVIMADNTRLKDIVGETCLLLNKQATHKQVQLIDEVGNDCIAFVDKEMMRVVVRNLLSNAIKFTNPGGFVKLRAGQNEQGNILLEIIDNGTGIPLEKHPLILGNDLFSTYGTANEKGTGLGLKICREFVGKNNGTLSFKSKPGAGTTFSITLPCSRMEILTADTLQMETGFFPNTKYAS